MARAPAKRSTHSARPAAAKSGRTSGGKSGGKSGRKRSASTQDDAPSSPRSIWKGAISFGLVYIPVSLHSATRESGIDFDWLDKRSLDPVGYKRINKKTGREITKENIVKGVAYESGKYVVLSEDEIAAAYPRSTQSIDIEAFVPAGQIPPVYLERPYYLAPQAKGEKVYALLREALAKSGRVGLARVVIQTKQHMAALVPSGRMLLLDLLRWDEDIRPTGELNLPAEGAKAAGLNPRELAMAERLVEDMSSDWKPEDYRDIFREKVMDLVHRKVKAGKTATVEPIEEAPPSAGADVIDLTALLQQSLKKGRQAPASSAAGKSSNGSSNGAASKTTTKAGGTKAAGTKASTAAAATGRRKRAA